MLFSVKTDTPALGVIRRIAIQDGRVQPALIGPVLKLV